MCVRSSSNDVENNKLCNIIFKSIPSLDALVHVRLLVNFYTNPIASYPSVELLLFAYFLFNSC